MRLRYAAVLLAVLAAGCLAVVSAASIGSSKARASTGNGAAWSTRYAKGSVRLRGEIPRAVATHATHAVERHSAKDDLTLSFALPLHNQAGLNKLIQREAVTHQYLTRKQIYARFAPSKAQYKALRKWLVSKGFTITHLGADRLAIGAKAPTSRIEKVLHVRIDNYRSPAYTYAKVKVHPYIYFANDRAPRVPARLGLQSISGLSNIDRFFTDAQMYAAQNPHARTVRSGGYFPSDLKGLYDITGHGFDGTGQTLGFTLWTAPETQASLTKFATDTGDQLITKLPSCTATGNSPTTPSSCSTQAVGADQLMFILENGNVDPGTNFGSNVETALDIESAHGVATHSGLKYYASECAANPPANSGLANAGCNGSDVGMEMALEDAANDPTLRSVSNSWGYGGEAEWGVTDPFVVNVNNILALGAAAGTSFYFSTGDAGTFQSGFPTDSPYVVSVGGTSTWSTSNPATWSTSTAWSGGGSWCSTQFARPSWQTGAGVAANAACPGRVSPDVSAVADPNTGVRFTNATNSTGGTQSGQVGGTSLAAPVMNGLQAVAQNFVNAQTYSGPTPKIGFVAPLLYQLGNSGHANSYFRDVECGDTANPTSGPDGDAAIKGWDAATGWGEPDWFNYATGFAQLLGATNVSTPGSLSQHFNWTCAKTPSNSTERAISCPSTSVCYAVGNSSGGTPWYGKFLPSGAWGAVNTIFKSTDGGQSWFPSNSDMFSIACTSTSSCLTVGAGGRERMTADGGGTWNDVATAPGNNKPLTQVECPSSSICYAVGDRGNIMKSTDGGQTWSWEFGASYGNPMYGLSCPSTTTCYASDIYAHVFKTTDGGATWAAQVTPITTPQVPVVAETGGPNPWGGMTGISCPDANTCVGVGIYATVSGQTNPNPDPPIVTTTDGGSTWTRQVSGAGTGNFLQAVSCLPGTQTCWAVGRAGKILTTTNLTTWTAQTSNTTAYLNSVYCSSTTFCIAVGQNGTVDLYNGTTWTATTGNGGTGTLADVTCVGSSCYATGKQGITLASTDSGATWAQQAGGGSQANQLNGISCTSTSTCYAAGNAGQLLKTTNGGQTWTIPTSGTTTALSGIACTSATACTAVGAVASGAAVVRTTTDGTTWNAGTGTGANALTGVACPAASQCVAVGAAGTARISSDGGATWTAGTTGTTNGLNAVSCPSVGTCYGAGAAGTLLKSADTGATWSPLTSGTTVALNGVACSSNSNCMADGASGFIARTTDGSTFAQQGNPLSGPTTAQNATSLTLNGAACTPVRCLVGGPAQGDLLYSIVGPTTTATVSPPSPDGQNGWYVTAPSVTLTATAGDFPVASTHYSIDGGPDTVYSGPFSINTDGSHTVSYYSVDSVGTMETPKSITLKVDLHNPMSSAQITPAPQNGWYASPTVTLTGNDGSGSGIDHLSYSIDGGAYQTYTGPLSGFSTGNHFVQFFATDVAGRVESPPNLVAFKADSDKPTVNIVNPADGAVYRLGASKNASYKCTDKQSGLASCVGTVPNGTPVDTSTIGTHAFTVTATDNAGNQTTVTVHYTVVYTFQGFFSPIGNPDDPSPVNLVHAGDLIKIGFGLDGDRGLDIGTFSSTPVACPAGAPHLVKEAGAGTSPGLSYGVASGHYSYGWQTDASWGGTCRQFSLVLNDGTAPHTAVFMFFS